MDLLLTADVHLRAENPERKEALEKIITRCESESVDYLLIAGDFFDANVDVEDVKTEVRDLFSDNSFQTLVIPGNHDRTAYREEDYFGDDIEILKQQPYTQRELGDVNLVAVPYFDGEFADVVDDIADAYREGQTNVLMLHCTLAGAGGNVFGTESRYLPVTPEELLQTSFEYVSAGHIHSSPTKRPIGEDIEFLYPGSPASITRSETGRRGVWLLNTDDDEVRQLDLDTFRYEQYPLELRPGEAEEALDVLQARLDDADLTNAYLLIEGSGFIEMDGEEFFDGLSAIVSNAKPAEYEIDRSAVKSVQSILQTDLYDTFKTKLEAKEDVDEEAVERFALEAMSRQSR